MFLSTDASASPNVDIDNAMKNLDLDILKKIENDLEIDDRLSILFLLICDYSDTFYEVFELFNKAKYQSGYMLYEYINKYLENWKEKFLEAVCVCNNKKIIKKLGLSSNSLNQIFVPKERTFSKNLNKLAKLLYVLSDALDEKETRTLIECVRNDGVEYDQKLNNVNHLELHMLYWMSVKYISISPECDIHRLLPHVKTFENIDLIYEDLKYYENRHNISEIKKDNKVKSCNQRITSSTNSELNAPVINNQVRRIEKGLCIIVSQMYFEGDQYETRFGTNADMKRLQTTFKKLGFDVHIYNNLKKEKLMEKISSIPKECNNSVNYDCLFFFILSHGFEGCIITSDEYEVSIKEIEEKICCIELRNVVKIVVIQACQGKTTGQINNSLTLDGPNNVNITDQNSDISRYRHFCMLMSTIQGFSSIRHKLEGSWFIQEFCNIIENAKTEILFMDLVMELQRRMEAKRGTMDEKQTVAQLPEIRNYRLATQLMLPNCSNSE